MITDSLLEYLAQFWNTKTFYRHYNTQFHHFSALPVYILSFRGQWPLDVIRGQIQFTSTS